MQTLQQDINKAVQQTAQLVNKVHFIDGHCINAVVALNKKAQVLYIAVSCATTVCNWAWRYNLSVIEQQEPDEWYTNLEQALGQMEDPVGNGLTDYLFDSY